MADARFAKPLDHALLQQLAAHHQLLVTIEEGAVGGFGSQVLHFLAQNSLIDRGLKVRCLTLKDEFTEQAKPETMYRLSGLDKNGIVATVRLALGLKNGR